MAVPPAASLALTVTRALEPAVAVPDTVPALASRSPDGRRPRVIIQRIGVAPPLVPSLIVVRRPAGTLSARVVIFSRGTILRGTLTVRALPLPSVTVTCAPYEPAAVGVPLISPPLTLRPGGRPPAAAQAYGDWPPVADNVA